MIVEININVVVAIINKIKKFSKEKIMVTDSISDILTRIRNATMVKHQIVPVPKTSTSKNILNILKDQGFIKNYYMCMSRVPEPGLPGLPEPGFYDYYSKKLYKQFYLVSLKYIGKDRKSVISKLERVSKPGLRVYTNSKTIPIVLSHLGMSIISTSRGVMPGNIAVKNNLGGEILCYIW